MTTNNLRQGKKYKVIKDFADANGNSFNIGRSFTYIKQHFMPYDEEYTLEFQEGSIVLHERLQENILKEIEEYFEVIST
jgi:hypothetical protein